ncbi:hypothetical protein K2173_003967 [Erythroxylum novogranatense]|uniref:Tetraspanin n=1 Tax=Erythroxylum novogranatense TaxID=1862640 RepID=A0AAV8SJ75_9ROSI|nr:hypothetical protein K2173_003967 [Erythroxylum novogranatense]
MVRATNTLLAVFNCVTLVLALTALGLGFYSFLGGNIACGKTVQNPLMVAGAALSMLSLLGLIGSLCRVNFFLILYVTVVFLLILGLIVFTIFTIFVTNEKVGEVIEKTRITNYFEVWLRNHVTSGKIWNDIKSCLAYSKVCTDGDIYKLDLSSIQLGCCKPPSSCGFQLKNATVWVPPNSSFLKKDGDCSKWSNQLEKLCYNCESCKDGFVGSIKNLWRALAILNVSATLIAVVVYTIGRCAMRNKRC